MPIVGGQFSLPQHTLCVNTREVDSEQSAWVAYEDEGACAKVVIADSACMLLLDLTNRGDAAA